MQNVGAMLNKGQEQVGGFVERSKANAGPLKVWGVTAAAAVAGAVALPALATGAMFVAGALASPPLAMTVGAIGGGVLGWRYMQNDSQADNAEVVATVQSTPAQPAAASDEAF